MDIKQKNFDSNKINKKVDKLLKNIYAIDKKTGKPIQNYNQTTNYDRINDIIEKCMTEFNTIENSDKVIKDKLLQIKNEIHDLSRGFYTVTNNLKTSVNLIFELCYADKIKYDLLFKQFKEIFSS